MNVSFKKQGRGPLLLSSVLLWTACCSPVIARSIYVNCNFIGTGTGAQGTPYATIGQATAVSAPGDTIIVADGIYNETVVPTSGTAGNYITYRAANRWGAQIVGVQDYGCFSFCGTGNGDSYNVNIPGQQYVAIDGFDLINPNTDGYAYGVKVNQANHITITNCRIHGCSCNGIGANYSDYLDFEHNIVYDNALNSVLGPSGISLWRTMPSDQAPGFHNIVSGNLVYFNRETGSNHTDGNGIIIDSTSQDVGTVVENNVVYDNGGAGIALDGSANCTVRFNTLYENSTDTITSYPEIRLNTVTWESGTPYNAACSNCSVYGNVIYAQPGRNALVISAGSVNCNTDHNLRFNSNSGDTVGTGDITTNPLFVNPAIDPVSANFHLQSGSPAIGSAGSGETTLSGADYDQQVRPQPAALGAYEYVALDGTYWLQAVCSNLNFIDPNYGSIGTVLEQATLQPSLGDGPNAEWTLTADGAYFSLQCVTNELVVGTDNSTAPEQLLTLERRTGADDQLWSITPGSGGAYVFTNRLSGYVMDVYEALTTSGAPIEQSPWYGGGNQQWAFTPASVPLSWYQLDITSVPNGVYQLTSNCGGLNLSDSSFGGAGTQLSQSPWESSCNTAWRFTEVGVSNYFQITSMANDLAVGVGNSSSEGQPVVLETPTGADDQLWYCQAYGGHQYTLFNKLSGYALDVSGASTSVGSLIDQWPWAAGGNQVWVFSPY